MAQSAVGAQIHEPLDVRGNISSQISLNLELALEDFPNAQDFGLGKLMRSRFGVDACPGNDVLGRPAADPVDGCQRDSDTLIFRQIDSCNSCHSIPPGEAPGEEPLLSALALFVPRVLADNPHNSLAPDDPALVANALHR